MLTLHARNVNQALPLAIQYFNRHHKDVREVPSRNGPTLEWAAPVCTVYERPMERVLFDPLRDANPFFHLFESLWILAGRRDVAFLRQFLPNIADYSDDGNTFHGAYGYRLRKLNGDQIRSVITRLTTDPNTRQAVVSIWDPEYDQIAKTKDLPCNDLLAFRVRDGKLDLTVYNRSNDVIWGAYGANAVQFAFILEYVAAWAGLDPGRYYQISNAFHIYKNEQWNKLKILNPATTWDPYEHEHFRVSEPENILRGLPKTVGVVSWSPIGNPLHFDHDLDSFFAAWELYKDPFRGVYSTQWFKAVILPVWEAFTYYKQARVAKVAAMLTEGAEKVLENCEATDWRAAIAAWMLRRKV